MTNIYTCTKETIACNSLSASGTFIFDGVRKVYFFFEMSDSHVLDIGVMAFCRFHGFDDD